MRSITKLTISLLSTSLLIPQSWKTTRARRTSIVVFDLKAALWSWEAKVNQLCHENTLSGYTPTEGLFSYVTVDSVRDCDTWLLCEMEAKIRTVGQYSKAQVGLIELLVRKSPTTDSEGEVSSDQGHSCLVYGFLLRLLSCESRIQRKGKSGREITRDFLSWGSVCPFTGSPCNASQVRLFHLEAEVEFILLLVPIEQLPCMLPHTGPHFLTSLLLQARDLGEGRVELLLRRGCWGPNLLGGSNSPDERIQGWWNSVENVRRKLLSPASQQARTPGGHFCTFDQFCHQSMSSPNRPLAPDTADWFYGTV